MKPFTIAAVGILLFCQQLNGQYYEFANIHSYGYSDIYPTRIKGIVVDALGRFIVAGDYQRTQFGNDRTFISLPSGIVTLVSTSGSYAYNILNSITTDGVGNVFITGFSSGYEFTIGSTTLTNPSGTGINYLAKFDIAGNIVYAKKKTHLHGLSVNNAGTILYATDGTFNYKINGTTGNTSLVDSLHGGAVQQDANGHCYIYQSDSLIKLSKTNFNVLWKRYAPGMNSFYTGNTNNIYLVWTDSIQKITSGNSLTTTYYTGGSSISINSAGQVYIFRTDGLHKYNSTLNSQLWHFELPPGMAHFATYGEHEIYIAGQFNYSEGLLLCPFQLSPWNTMVTDNVGYSAKINDLMPAPFQAHIATGNPAWSGELCTGQSITVPFNVCTNSSSQFAPNNAFYVELSNASGYFTNPINIGPPGNAVIPDTVPTGNGYKIRVNSSNPPVIGDEYPDVFAEAYNLYGFYIQPVIAHISALGPTGLCVNGSVKIKSDSSASNYSWYIDDVLQDTIPGSQDSIVITSPCSVYCIMGGGCYKKSNTIYVTNSIPAAPIFALGTTTFCAGDSVILATNNCTGCSYKWKKNGANISGAFASQYTAKQAGNYKVVVTGANGCTKISTQKTVTINCRQAGEIETSSDAILLYPNPSTGKTKLVFNLAREQRVVINLLNTLGELVDVLYSGNQVAGESELEFDVSKLSTGIYFIILENQDGNVRKKLSVVRQ